MRVPCVAAVAAALSLTIALPVLAADQTVPAEPQRIEVTEAGAALSFPDPWAVDIEMREREDWGLSERYDDAAPLRFWQVLYASDGGRPWCDLTWYPWHPMTLDEHALEYELLMMPTLSDVQRTIEVTPLPLPAGEAVRLVIYNEPTDDWTTTYLLAADTARYLLRCVSDERAPDDWLELAEGFELLDATEARPTP